MRAPLLAVSLLLPLLAVGCATPTVPAAESVPFAEALVARAETGAPRTVPVSPELPAPGAPSPAAGDVTDGLLAVGPARAAELTEIADDAEALARALEGPVTRDDLAALAVARSPAVAAARAGVDAARTRYAQSRDLEDLVAIYRSFAVDTATRVGPDKVRAATMATWPGVGALSAELAERQVEIAREELRGALLDTVAAAERAHADAAYLAEARRVLQEQVGYEDSLLSVLRARLESGQGAQAGYQAFRGRLDHLRNELGVLANRETAVRAAWNRLLDRPEDASVQLDVAFADPAPPPEPAAVVDAALAQRPEMRAARSRAERGRIAVRLAETMTLPRMDVGSARYERERAREAGPERGSVFPAPGRMQMPRADFGVREAQLQELRARAEAAEAMRTATERATASGARSALVAYRNAVSREMVQGTRVVPLARSSLDSARGAYEGSGASYLDLLDAARRLLDARLLLADHRRDRVHAHAALLRATGTLTCGRDR